MIPSSTRYPAPFPEGLPTIELRRITIDDLLSERNEDVSRRLFNVLSTEGFFYLDLAGPRGSEFRESADALHDAARHVLNGLTVTEKEQYKGNPFVGELDKGYRALDKDESGIPRTGEMLNVPMNNLLNNSAFELPTWLAPYKQVYSQFALTAHAVGQALLHHLEEPLGLPHDSLASLHRSSSNTSGFVRAFRYPGPQPDRPPPSAIGNPAHTDGNAITILFNWQGGFQIARPKESSLPKVLARDDGQEWLWLRPEPGCALVELGDPLVIFTNGVLKSGMHRVVRPPGDQARYDRYSVLAGLRPRGTTPMKALSSEVIPKDKVQAGEDEILTAHQWAMKKVTTILRGLREK